MNWNVWITLVQRILDSFAQGIWGFVALPTYIWLIENHSNTVRPVQSKETAVAGAISD